MAQSTREQTLGLARSFVGTAEYPANTNRVLFSKWYGFVGPWCAMFVSYILSHSGYPFHMAYCPDIVNWAQRNGRWFTSRSQARAGDLILYSFEGRRADHVGFVLGRLSDGRMMTVEGNTGSNNRDGGSVQIRYRNSGIIGFVRMDYPEQSTPSAIIPQLPILKERHMVFFFTAEGAKRTFMGDGFHFREVTDTDRAMYAMVYKSQTGKDIGTIHLTSEQFERMTNVGP